MHESHDLIVVIRLELHGLGIHGYRARIEGIAVSRVPILVLHRQLEAGGEGQNANRQIRLRKLRCCAFGVVLGRTFGFVIRKASDQIQVRSIIID